MRVSLYGNQSVGKSSLINESRDDMMISQKKIKEGIIEEEIAVTFPDQFGNPKGSMVTIVKIDNVNDVEVGGTNIQAHVLVYDVTNKESFSQLSHWLEAIHRSKGERNKDAMPIVMIVGNKADLNHEVSTEYAQEWADNRGFLFMETSVKLKKNCTEIFSEVVKKATLETDWLSWKTCLLDLTQPISARTRAAFYLRTDGSLRSLQTIMTALQYREDTPLMRHELGYVLGQMQNSYACDVLASVLSDESDDLLVRHECAEALGAIGDTRSLDVLTQYSTHNAPEISETCLIALDLFKWRAQQQQQEKENQNNLGNTDKNHHFLSVDPAPPAVSAGKSVETLQQELMDTKLSLFQRYRAMFSLRNINSDESALALCHGLFDTSALFRHEAAYVLGQMEKEVTIPSLSKVLMNTLEHRMVRHECAESLGAIGGDEVAEILRKFREDSESVVKESCEVALDAMDYWNTFSSTSATVEAA